MTPRERYNAVVDARLLLRKVLSDFTLEDDAALRQGLRIAEMATDNIAFRLCQAIPDGSAVEQVDEAKAPVQPCPEHRGVTACRVDIEGPCPQCEAWTVKELGRDSGLASVASTDAELECSRCGQTWRARVWVSVVRTP